MKRSLKSGWCAVFKFCVKSLVFLIILSFSIILGSENERGQNPFILDQTERVVRISLDVIDVQKDPANPYQIIYDAFVEGRELDDVHAKKVREQFIDPSMFSGIFGTKKGKKYSKSYLWAPVFSSGSSSDFFDIAEKFLYDEKSKDDRAKWRSEVFFEGNSVKDIYFEGILSIDSCQDRGMVDVVFNKLTNLCSDDKANRKDIDILNAWRKSIEEEALLDFTKNTFLDAESKNWSTDRFDRFVVITKPIVAFLSGLCVFVLVYQLTPTAVVIENIGLVSWTNSSLNILNTTILSNITMDLSFKSEDETFFNITAQAYKTKQSNQLSPTIIPLSIITFISTLTIFIFDAISASFHSIFYLLNNDDIEKVPDDMIQKLYEKSKILQENENRKNYIKTMSIYIVDTFKKCWSYSSAQKKCYIMMEKKIKNYV
ncbi:MAG: hypothetical protein KBD31_00295 [Proteobacteria bacterium]|nr:hypothetical protein [Pseudomonadota bacterium]